MLITKKRASSSDALFFKKGLMNDVGRGVAGQSPAQGVAAYLLANSGVGGLPPLTRQKQFRAS